MLGLVCQRLARSLRPTVASQSLAEVRRVVAFPRFLSSSSAEYPWEKSTDLLEDGDEPRDPPGTPWNPAPVAHDYEETLSVLLHGEKVEAALDILARMVKRGFRPSPEIVDLLYTTTKAKPEYQALAVKTINSLDTTSWK